MQPSVRTNCTLKLLLSPWIRISGNSVCYGLSLRACTSMSWKARARNGVYVDHLPCKNATLNLLVPQISPAHTYFSTHLPKLLLGSLPLAIFGCIIDARAMHTIYPALAFIALLSRIGHKEWRFIVYVIPMFNIAAARGASWMFVCSFGMWRNSINRAFSSFKRDASLKFLRRLFALGVLGLVFGNILVTSFMTYISHVNYPGGEALSRLHAVVDVPKGTELNLDSSFTPE